MKAAYIEQRGGPENIVYGDVPVPELKEWEVLVRMKAVAVNHVDAYLRSGVFSMDIPLPFVIGRDLVGVVEDMGSKARKFAPGDRVWSNCLGIEGLQGTFAEYVAAPEERLYALPAEVQPQSAVAVLHSGLTALIGLFAKARLAAGDTVFINGGSGSVGLAVLQIAKACGASVAVTAGSEIKAAWCRQMGADTVVDYHQEDIAAAVRRFAPAGLDIFWEATRAPDFEAIMTSMASHGRLIVMSGRDAMVKFSVWPFFVGNCSIHGFTVTGTTVRDLRSYARQINAWLSNGTLKAKIDQVLPLSQAANAHRKQEEGKLFGKIVLVPDADIGDAGANGRRTSSP